MQRRDALASLAASGAGLLLAGCKPASPLADASAPAVDVGALLHALTDYTLRPGEGPAVLTSFQGARFTAPVDPTIQPTDFDAEVDA